MTTPSLLLAGITQHTVKTDRLEIAYLEAGHGSKAIVLIHGNTSSSLFYQDFMLELAATGRYTVYAPDMRGYGDTQALPINATRGLRDFSDDLFSLAQALGLDKFHLFGWSMGGNAAMQFAIDHAETLLSLTLESPGSPFGFGGTKGAEGTPIWPDFAGSGGGTANPDFVQRLGRRDRGSEQFSPRTVLNAFYFKPPFQAAPDREEMYVTSMLSCKVTEGIYPGDMTASDNWPTVAPGTQGPNNALSPKYMNQADLATINPKPSILWIRGADDQIVSDTSFFDFGFLGQLGAVPGWPGADVYPAQPMIAQIHTVFDNYRANGGEYREVVLSECGHSPHIEKQEEVFRLFTEFVESHT
jgi:pimeloyl-ACP methyl ester carboxylesterase